MRIFKDYNQKQTFLLPPSVEEFVPAEHSVRRISIDSLARKRLIFVYSLVLAISISCCHVLAEDIPVGPPKPAKEAPMLKKDVVVMVCYAKIHLAVQLNIL